MSGVGYIKHWQRHHQGQLLQWPSMDVVEGDKGKEEPRIVYHSTLSFMFCSDATPMFMNLCLFCRLLLLFFPCSHTF